MNIICVYNQRLIYVYNFGKNDINRIEFLVVLDDILR